MVHLTKQGVFTDLKTRIDQLLEEHGSYRSISKYTGVDTGYLYHLRKGTKDNPKPETCKKLGLKRHVSYTAI